MPSEQFFKDRIKELRRVKASELIGDEDNPNTHPQVQVDVMEAMLSRIGFADALLAYETKEGLKLVDGHMRTGISNPDQEVPVLILDIGEEEAKQVLATMDNITKLAGREQDKMSELLERCNFHEGAISSMMYRLRQDSMERQEKMEEAEEKAKEKSKEEENVKYPITPVFNEKYNYVVIFSTNTIEWAYLMTALKIAKERSYKNSYVGIGKVLAFDVFRKLWEGSREIPDLEAMKAEAKAEEKGGEDEGSSDRGTKSEKGGKS